MEQVRETGRAAQGVRLINLDEGTTLVSIERVAEENSDEEAELVELMDNTSEVDTSNEA